MDRPSRGPIDGDSSFKTLESWFERPLIDTTWTRAYKGNDLINRTELLLHPMEYMTTLVQIGYEPLPPKLTKSLFGRTQLQLPGFFGYMNYIIKTDGFFGIYRGLRYNIAYSVAYRFVYSNVDNLQKQANLFGSQAIRDDDAKYKDLKTLSLSLVGDSLSRVTALAVAYPLHVMMVRSMAQFVGNEEHYNSFIGSILDIYYTGGLLGFYSGFVPFALANCVLLFLESGVVYLLRNHVDRSLELWKNSFVLSSITIVTRSLVYPFRIVSTIMSCNGSSARSLAASAYTAPEYDNWQKCLRTLWARGEIKRGSSLFWRYQPITSSLMFPTQPLAPLAKVRRQL